MYCEVKECMQKPRGSCHCDLSAGDISIDEDGRCSCYHPPYDGFYEEHPEMDCEVGEKNG